MALQPFHHDSLNHFYELTPSTCRARRGSQTSNNDVYATQRKIGA